MSRPARVLLVRHGPTAATRRHAFPADEPLDRAGAELAASTVGTPAVDRAVAATSVSCRQTAAALGMSPAATELDPRWDDLDVGRWAGRTLTEVWDDDRDTLERWLADPTTTPTGGEALAELGGRVAAALADLRSAETTTLVVTAASPIKVAVLQALGAPLTRLWHLDVAPCSVTTLHARPDGGWTLRGVNADLTTIPMRPTCAPSSC